MPKNPTVSSGSDTKEVKNAESSRSWVNQVGPDPSSGEQTPYNGLARLRFTLIEMN